MQISAVNLSAVATNFTATGNYCIVRCGAPAMIYAVTLQIVNGAAPQTAGVGAWVIIGSDGVARQIANITFPAINALAANSCSFFDIATATFSYPMPCLGFGFAITTTMSQTIARAELNALVA